MPSNHPHQHAPDDPAAVRRPPVYGLLAGCALLFGAALLVLDREAGASDGRRLLLIVGLVSLGGALALGVAATLERRRR